MPLPRLPAGAHRVINGSGLFPGSAAQAGNPPSQALLVWFLFFFFLSLPFSLFKTFKMGKKIKKEEKQIKKKKSILRGIFPPL